MLRRAYGDGFKVALERFAVKEAAVNPWTKQYRRAVQLLRGPTPTYFHTGEVPKILESGAVKPGYNNLHGRETPEAYFAQGRPWHDMTARTIAVPGDKFMRNEGIRHVPAVPPELEQDFPQLAGKTWGLSRTPVSVGKGDTAIHWGRKELEPQLRQSGSRFITSSAFEKALKGEVDPLTTKLEDAARRVK